MPASEEPSIPQKMQWPLAALWISLGLHGALLALVQIAPPPAGGAGIIEARLILDQPRQQPHLLTPSLKTDETLAVEPEPVMPDTRVEPTFEPEPNATSALPDTPAPRGGLEIPLSVDLTYYSARELDETPRGNIPDPVLSSALPGRVKLRAKVEENGQVSAVEVVASEPPGVFDNAALDAFKRTHFKPGIRNGRPVRSLIDYELTINSGAAQDVPQ